MNNERDIFFAAAINRMRGDFETAYGLFGAAVSVPSTLQPQLRVDGVAGGAGDVSGAKLCWTARAAELTSLMNRVGDAAARRCAAAAIDDSDARVRGIAWCLLSAFSAADCIRLIDASIAAEFASRRPPMAERAPWDNQANSMPAIMRGIFTTLRVNETLCRLNEEYIEAHAGSDASAIQLGWRHALPFLEHYDSGRRLAAMRAIAHAGKEAAEASNAIASLAESDADSQVRVAAVLAYIAIFRGSRDADAMRFLAELVVDDLQAMLLRVAAYDGLFSVQGSPRKEHPLSRVDPERLDRLRNSVPPLDWPVDVDWKFVHACASGNGPAERPTFSSPADKS